MKIDVRSIATHTLSLTWVAFRSFAGTLSLFILLGIILAALSCYFLRHHPWYYPALAAALALIEGAVIGFIVASKRAIAMTLAHALGSLHLGGSLVRLVFERMLGIKDTQESVQRYARLNSGLQRIPLAQAQTMLTGAVRSVTGETAQTGWLRRKIQTRLLRSVQSYTLAQFRDDDAKHGGIDLLTLKEHLQSSIDDILVRKIRSKLMIVTVLALLAFTLLVAAQTILAAICLHYFA